MILSTKGIKVQPNCILCCKNIGYGDGRTHNTEKHSISLKKHEQNNHFQKIIIFKQRKTIVSPQRVQKENFAVKYIPKHQTSGSMHFIILLSTQVGIISKSIFLRSHFNSGIKYITCMISRDISKNIEIFNGAEKKFKSLYCNNFKENK